MATARRTQQIATAAGAEVALTAHRQSFMSASSVMSQSWTWQLCHDTVNAVYSTGVDTAVDSQTHRDGARKVLDDELLAFEPRLRVVLVAARRQGMRTAHRISAISPMVLTQLPVSAYASGAELRLQWCANMPASAPECTISYEPVAVPGVHGPSCVMEHMRTRADASVWVSSCGCGAHIREKTLRVLTCCERCDHMWMLHKTRCSTGVQR